MPVSSYSTNPALNTSVGGSDISEGAAAAGFNNALRQIMADIKAWSDAFSVVYPISIAQGGTGQTTALAAFNAIAASGGTVGGVLSRTSYGQFVHFAQSVLPEVAFTSRRSGLTRPRCRATWYSSTSRGRSHPHQQQRHHQRRSANPFP
jgi:hypothetical protein